VPMTSNRHFAYVQLFCGGRNGRGRRPAYVPSSNQHTIVEKKRTGRWVEIQRLASLCFLAATLAPQGGCQAALDATLGARTLESATLVAGTLEMRTLVDETLVDETLVLGILVMETLVDESPVTGILVTETLVDEWLVAGILVMGPLVDESLVAGTLDDVTLGAATLCFLAATWVQQSGHQSASDFVHNAVVAQLCSLPVTSVHQGEGEAFGHSNRCSRRSLRWGEHLQQEMRRLEGYTHWFSL
jgi:hypothetical protein